MGVDRRREIPSPHPRTIHPQSIGAEQLAVHDERWSLAVETLAQLETGSNATAVLDTLATKVGQLFPELVLLRGDLMRLVPWVSGGYGESLASLADAGAAVNALLPSGEKVSVGQDALTRNT